VSEFCCHSRGSPDQCMRAYSRSPGRLLARRKTCGVKLVYRCRS